MNGLENQRGHPFVKEIAASRVLKWMARALLRPKIRSRFNTWLIYMRWFRFLHRCRRGVKKITKWYHRQSLRRWVTYTAWHRKQEMERASVQLQRIVRAHFGRITAYKRLLFVTAWSIQYFWHRCCSNKNIDFTDNRFNSFNHESFHGSLKSTDWIDFSDVNDGTSSF